MLEKYDYLIVGGGIAGITAAEEIRSHDEKGSIAVIGNEPDMTYSRVMLPHVTRGKVPEERVILRTHEAVNSKRIDFLRGAKVESVSLEDKKASLSDGTEIEFGSMLVATGGRARKLGCQGDDCEGILHFQTIQDARDIVEQRGAATSAVVGGSFIAIELLMTFLEYGHNVTAVIRGDGFFAGRLSESSKKRVANAAEAAGVRVLTGVSVESIEKEDGKFTTRLSDGQILNTDVLATGIGIEPNVDFLPKEDFVSSHGVDVDEYLETTAKGVFAAGDVACFHDVRLGKRHNAGNWQNAMFQGKRAGANMAGVREAYDALTTYSISCFGLPMAFMGSIDGFDERIVREEGSATIEFFVSRGKVAGAAIVGQTSARGAIQGIVTRLTEVDGRVRGVLEDPMKDLKSA